MAFVVAALEVSDKIQTVGAFAGFAAILGLAVLSVLYFGQAREVKRLREWAGRAPERAAEMQDRVVTDASRRVVAQPVAPARPPAAQPATPGAAAAAARPAGATPAAAGAAAGAAAAGAAAAIPAGTPAATPPAATPAGAPAATKTPPVGAPTVAGRVPPVEGEATAAKPADGTDQPTVLQPTVPNDDAATLAAAAGAPPPPAATPPAASPATPAGATPAPASKPPTPPTSPQATPTGPATPAGGRAPAPAARPAPAVPLRSERASRTAPTATAAAEAPSSSPAGATIAIIAAVGAILVAIVLVVTGVIGGDDGGDPVRNVIVPTAPEPATSTNGTTATPLNRAGVSVVVLNGTGVPNLAREASDKLGRDGYRLAAAGNRGDATVTKTAVLYAPGNERAARDIVRLLKLGAVGELDAGTEVVAQPHAKPAGTKPEVVVTLGADAAQS